LVDIERFSLYVATKNVWKTWSHVILPDGKILMVPGKYIKVSSEKPLAFGFEDMTEEIGENPDYDYQQPYIEVIQETKNFIVNTIKLKYTYKGDYENHLYFDNVLIRKFKPSKEKEEGEIEFSYIALKPFY
jgi:hypothetical protein